MTGAVPIPAREPETPLRANIDVPFTKGEVLRWAASPAKHLPDFLILGASKAGTTSLFTYLADLPWITGPFYKELHFFSYRWHRGMRFYRSRFPLDWRQQAAARRAGTRAMTGEASPSYLFYPYVPERVAEAMPRVKLIALLRNPVDRAYSAYQHSVYWGWETLSFEDALDREEERLVRGGQPEEQAEEKELLFSAAYHSYVRHGLYAQQLTRWYEHFGRKQLKLVTTEELRQNPAAVVAEVCDYLGTRFEPRESYEVFNYNRGQARYAPMRPATRQRLIQLFRPHNAELYLLLGRRFDWDR